MQAGSRLRKLFSESRGEAFRRSEAGAAAQQRRGGAVAARCAGALSRTHGIPWCTQGPWVMPVPAADSRRRVLQGADGSSVAPGCSPH